MRHFGPLLILLSIFSCNSNGEYTLVEKRSITESVYASVTIQPDSLYQAHSVVSGILEDNLVDEGTTVEKHQSIIQIINNTPKLNSQNSKLAYALALENYEGSSAILNSIKDEINAAELQYKNDSINFSRQEKLWNQDIGSKAQYDALKLQFQLSRNSLNLLKSKLTRTDNELKTAVEQAYNNYKTSLISTKDFTIQSKINGKVYALYKEPGEIVTTMEPLASIGSATDFVLEMLVDEVDIVKISTEQVVLVTLDAYQDNVFEAIVSKIYPKKDERNQTFLVEAIFKRPPSTLYPGLSGEANIIISKRENVLSIPKTFITGTNELKTEDGIITVETGIESMDYVEIVSGISENTKIYKPD